MARSRACGFNGHCPQLSLSRGVGRPCTAAATEVRNSKRSSSSGGGGGGGGSSSSSSSSSSSNSNTGQGKTEGSGICGALEMGCRMGFV